MCREVLPLMEKRSTRSEGIASIYVGIVPRRLNPIGGTISFVEVHMHLLLKMQLKC
jgi:hypothetical protein